MRILGVDPGLNCTGYGVVDYVPPDLTLVEGGTILTDAKAPLEIRLATIANGIRGVLRDLAPDLMVVEQLYSKYEHPHTAILMGHARGTVLLAGAERGLEVAEYAASLVKRSLTGHGRASKQQVGAMVAQILGLADPPEPADITDALALCLCHTSPMRDERQRGKAGRGELAPAVAEALSQHQGGRRR